MKQTADTNHGRHPFNNDGVHIWSLNRPEAQVHTHGASKHNSDWGLNFNLTPRLHQRPSSSLDGMSAFTTISEGRIWSYHNLIEFKQTCNYDLEKIIPSSELQQLQKLESIHVDYCDNLEEVFEVVQGMTNSETQTVVEIPKLREMNLKYMNKIKYIWRSNQSRILEFPNLTTLLIKECHSLEHVFTCSMAGSLIQLQELHIAQCDNMKVVIKQEDEDFDVKSTEIKLPRLRSLKLNSLLRLEGFCLGKQDFTLPSLDTLEITECPRIAVFTQGHSVTLELTTVETSFGLYNINTGEDINTFIMTKRQQGFEFGSYEPSSSKDDE